MSHLGKAIAMAATCFRDAADRSGEPYIMHCIRVMNNPRCNTTDRKIAAILHDTVEDGYLTLEDLATAGFSQHVVYLIGNLTHNKEKDSYDDYIKRIATDEDTAQIKMADLEDNSQITRLKGLGKKDFDRIEKYHRSYVYLSRR
jgi:(p)ppGpp synthase/HD superfamily hydrolase